MNKVYFVIEGLTQEGFWNEQYKSFGKISLATRYSSNPEISKNSIRKEFAYHVITVLEN